MVLSKPIRGILEPWFETGTEGIVWSVYEDRRPEAVHEQWNYKKLHPLKTGDRLVIYAPDDKTVVFDEMIWFDWKKGWRAYPIQGQGGVVHGQQTALGLWVNGVQFGYDPDEWAKFFFPHRWMGESKDDIRPLWATLYKRKRSSLTLSKQDIKDIAREIDNNHD